MGTAAVVWGISSNPDSNHDCHGFPHQTPPSLRAGVSDCVPLCLPSTWALEWLGLSLGCRPRPSLSSLIYKMGARGMGMLWEAPGHHGSSSYFSGQL